MKLKPLNNAKCPRCVSSETMRGGYLKERKGSAWKCRKCGTEFIVPTLVLVKVPDSSPKKEQP